MQIVAAEQPRDWRRPFWLSLLVAASVAFTLAFACATPFAAFAAVAACTLARRAAFYLAGAIWLANQGIGFAFLHYPWTPNCFAWGAMLGVAALLSTLTARLAVVRLWALHLWARNALVFLVAFAAYEATLMGSALWLGGMEDFTIAKQIWIFFLNAIAWLGLFALNRAGIVTGIATSASMPRG